MSRYQELNAEDAHRAASRLESAVKEAAHVADRVEEAVRQMKMLTEDGYGNNVCRFIEEATKLRALSHQGEPHPDSVMWRNIDTAPTDGTEFIGLRGRKVFRCVRSKCYQKWPHEEGGPTFTHGWSMLVPGHVLPLLTGEEPTHWIPYPTAIDAARSASKEGGERT